MVNALLTAIMIMMSSGLQSQGPQSLDWKVGDTTDFSVNMGFIKGTIHSFVREEVSEGFWVQQDVDLMIQKSKIEILIDKHSGQIIAMIVNGEKQTPPDNSDIELIETKEDRITVPAGTYNAVYIRARNKKDNTEIQQWVNPSEIPVTGMLKAIQPSQFGEVVMELTSFRKM